MLEQSGTRTQIHHVITERSMQYIKHKNQQYAGFFILPKTSHHNPRQIELSRKIHLKLLVLIISYIFSMQSNCYILPL